MARTGRPRKPKAQKQLEGTYRKDRDTGKEPPVLDIEVVESPSWLNATGNKAFLQMAEMLQEQKALSKTDLQSLAVMSDIYSDVVSLSKQIKKEGRVYESITDTGIIKRPNPKFQMLSKVRDQWNRYAAEFGMSPASRAKIQTAIKEEEDDPLAKLMEM
jgi:P27 family predicted phage terminase small subunit